MSTRHGTVERVRWTVVQNRSYTSFGEHEKDARDEYVRRLEVLRKGETLALERTVSVESWIHHTEVIVDSWESK